MVKLKSLEKPQYSDWLKLEELTDVEGYKTIDLRPMNTKFGSALFGCSGRSKSANKKMFGIFTKTVAVNLTSDEVKEIASVTYKLKCKGEDTKIT